MPDMEHFAQLRQGVEAWNQWRAANPYIPPDLYGATFYRADLREADLRGADLTMATLTEADLRGADLTKATLYRAYLREADLRGADLTGVNLSGTDLSGADFTKVHIGWTVFGDVNLRSVRGLDTLYHNGPSTIGIDTLYHSQGDIPEVFLRGAGVPEDMITHMRSLVGRPFEYYSCFISYSSKDQKFADRLHADLLAKGVRCWFAPEDLKIGEKFRAGINEAIRLRDKLLLVLSTYSIASEWVEKEVETAFDEERRRKKTVLFPVRLDNTVMETAQSWAADIRLTRHIGDFRRWKGHDSYGKAFDRLLRDLQADTARDRS